MARKNTIKLLLINGSDNDSERLVSLFRNAGRVARAERVRGAEHLNEALRESWDLLIADDRHPDLNIETTLNEWRRASVDFPAIVQRVDADLPALFAAGAREVVAPEDEQRLILAALRELETVELRRQVERLRERLQEAEQRNALLLGEADQAIAYVADGMIIGANPLFAERFGYADPDELDCLPIIDLIDPDHHESFKAQLKTGAGDLPFRGLRADQESFSARLSLHGAYYDDEPCIQLIVEQPAPATHETSAAAGVDADTGLCSRAALLRQISGAGCLLLIGIDQFTALRRQLGFGGGARLLTELAAFIAAREALPGASLARLGDDSLAVLAPRIDVEQARAWAQQLCQDVEAHIVDLGDQSRQCTISIGIVGFDQHKMPEALLDEALAACEKVREQAGDSGIGNGVSVFESAHPAIEPGRFGANSHSLENALEQQRFALLFQPVISLRGATGEHYEVLLRMRGDTDELELPDNFLDSLGVNADNAKLDRWILLEATKRLAEHRARGNDTRLIINLTVNALQDESLAGWLGVALKAAGLPGSTLLLQLREIDVSNYLLPARNFAEAVCRLGCRFSISGFGQVPDPLKTLKNLPAGWVQIDGAFTRALQTGGDAQPLKALVSAVGEQEIQVIVPFVENAQVLATLWQVGADFIQGHYLQAPGRDMNYEFTDIA